MKEYTVLYKNKRYQLLWVGTTKKNKQRALLMFLYGKATRKFWVDTELVSDIRPLIRTQFDTVSKSQSK